MNDKFIQLFRCLIRQDQRRIYHRNFLKFRKVMESRWKNIKRILGVSFHSLNIKKIEFEMKNLADEVLRWFSAD